MIIIYMTESTLLLSNQVIIYITIAGVVIYVVYIFYNYCVLPVINYFFPPAPPPPASPPPEVIPSQYELYLNRKVEDTLARSGLIQDF